MKVFKKTNFGCKILNLCVYYIWSINQPIIFSCFSTVGMTTPTKRKEQFLFQSLYLALCIDIFITFVCHYISELNFLQWGHTHINTQKNKSEQSMSACILFLVNIFIVTEEWMRILLSSWLTAKGKGSFV